MEASAILTDPENAEIPPSLPVAFIYPFLLHPFSPSLGLFLHTHEHARLRSAVHPLFFPFYPP